MWLHTMVKKYLEEKPDNNEFKPKFKCPMKYGQIYGTNDKNLVSERNFMTSFWNYIMKISKQIYDLLMKKLSPDGITLIQNNGLPQVVKHYHLHLIPKYKNEIKEDIKSVFDKITK